MAPYHLPIQLSSLLASIYWDPDPVAFYIPFTNHPVMWYGILFALGFLISYWVMQWFMQRQLLLLNEIDAGEILDWQTLVTRLQLALNTPDQSTLAPLVEALSPSDRITLRQLDPAKSIPESLKNKILEAIQRLLTCDSPSISEALNTHAFCKSSHYRWATRIQHENPIPLRRLWIMELLSDTFAPLSDTATRWVDKMCWMIVVGVVVGARLGHILFYDLHYYIAHPSKILVVWEGGLASHGGVIGGLIGLLLFSNAIKKHYRTLVRISLLDLACICSGVVTGCIRLGNFVNQEIVGNVSSLPWAVYFAHPTDGTVPLARHPVQLYEAAGYFILFGALSALWMRRGHQLIPGFVTGLLFTAIFSHRICMEFLKTPQGGAFTWWGLDTGQVLSLPFVLIGCYLMVRCRQRPLNTCVNTTK